MNTWINGAMAGSVAAAHALEDAIEQQGNGAAYARALSTIIGMAYLDLEADSDAVDSELWRLIRATPKQRAEAYVMVTHNGQH